MGFQFFLCRAIFHGDWFGELESLPSLCTHREGIKSPQKGFL